MLQPTRSTPTSSRAGSLPSQSAKERNKTQKETVLKHRDLILNVARKVWRSRSAYLYRHGPQVGAEEEEPHELVGLYSHQVVDLPQRHLPHRHVGGGQTQDFVVNHRLVNETRHVTMYNYTSC